MTTKETKKYNELMAKVEQQNKALYIIANNELEPYAYRNIAKSVITKR